MIGRSLQKAPFPQHVRDERGGFLQRDINDCGTGRSFGQSAGEDVDATLQRAWDMGDARGEVGAHGRRSDNRVIRNGEGVTDIARHLRRGGCGEGEAPGAVEAVGPAGQAEVVGSEGVPPLGDAVGLIDDEELDVEGSYESQEAVVLEALGRDEEDGDVVGAEAVEQVARLGRREGRVQRGGADLPLDERVHLVLHEGHERGHDEREPAEQQRRELVAERLPRAGGEDGERAAGALGGGCRRRGAKHVLNGVVLAGAEGGVVEALLEELLGCLHGGTQGRL